MSVLLIAALAVAMQGPAADSTAPVASATLIIYAVVYTPLKPVTSFATVVGAGLGIGKLALFEPPLRGENEPPDPAFTAEIAELVSSGRAAAAQAQTAPASPPAIPPPPVFKHDLPDVTMDDWEVTVSYVDYAPGRVGSVHHHAGFVLAYVIEGAVITKISDQGEEKTYSTGQMFYEQPGATHEVSKNASETQPARLLAMIFAKKGSTLTTPGPARQ